MHGAFIADAFRPLLSEPALAGFRLMSYHRHGYGGSTPAAEAGKPRTARATPGTHLSWVCDTRT